MSNEFNLMHTHTSPQPPPETLGSILRSVARILDGVILGAESSGNLRQELVSLLDQIMEQSKHATLSHTTDGSIYEINREQVGGSAMTMHGTIRINLSTFVCTYTTNPGTTFFEGEHDESGTINFVENGEISRKNIDFVLKKIGINANNSCCIS